MSRNPYLNALGAILYIVLVAVFMSSVPENVPDPETMLGAVPLIVGFLSLFVLSAAVTGYLIIGTPLQLFLEGQKKEAVTFFFKTLLAFAVIAAALSTLAFFFV